MPVKFDAALTDVMGKVFTMANLAEVMVDSLVQMLTERRQDMLQQIYDNEKQLDTLQLEVDNAAVEMIGVFTPVAADLRLLLMLPRISSSLERIGDQAENVCHVVQDDMAKDPFTPLEHLSRMATIGRDMLRKSIKAFSERSQEQALEVLRMDTEVDKLNTLLRDQLIGSMEREPAHIRRALGLQRIAKAVERVADHATTVAEATIFVVSGNDVRHLRLDEEQH